MKKATKLILMLCFILSGTLCYQCEAKTENVKVDDVPIELIEVAGSSSGLHKGSSIIPTLNGHVLTVVFNENLGQVSVEVATTLGATVESLLVPTPNGVQVYIPNAGNYIVTFTLSDGDGYYGEFTVTN